MFNMNNSLFGHETKFYRLNKDEVELRNVSRPYSNVTRYISVIYQRRGQVELRHLKNPAQRKEVSTLPVLSKKPLPRVDGISHWDKKECWKQANTLLDQRLKESKGHAVPQTPIQFDCAGQTYLCMTKKGDEDGYSLKANCKIITLKNGRNSEEMTEAVLNFYSK